MAEGGRAEDGRFDLSDVAISYSQMSYDTAVTHKSAQGISVVSILVTSTKGEGRTLLRPEDILSALFNLDGRYGKICTYVRGYYHDAISRYVQTSEVVL